MASTVPARTAATATYASWPPRSRPILVLLTLFIALGFSDKAMLGLIGPPMSADLGLSKSEFGLVGSSFSVLFAVSAIGCGLLGNRVSSRWLLATLALVWTVAQLPVLLPAAGFAALIGTRILLGAGEGPALPLASHTAFTWAPPPRRALAAAVLAVGGSAGIVVGAPLLVLTMDTLGWRAPFGILGGLGLMWAAAWLLLGGPGPFAAPAPGGGSAAAETGPARARADGAAADVVRKKTYGHVFRRSTWWASVLAGFSVSWALGLALTWLPTYLEQQQGYRPAAVSLLVGLPSAGSIAAILGAGYVADRLLRRGASRRTAYALVPTVALIASGMAMLAMTAFGPGVPLLAAMTVAFSAGPALTPLANTAMGEISPAGKRSGVLATAHAVASLGGVIAPFVSGLIAQTAGFDAALDLAAGLLLVGALLAALGIRPERDVIGYGPQLPVE